MFVFTFVHDQCQTGGGFYIIVYFYINKEIEIEKLEFNWLKVQRFLFDHLAYAKKEIYKI